MKENFGFVVLGFMLAAVVGIFFWKQFQLGVYTLYVLVTL